MGRSSSISCFKIIACGSDSAAKSDLEQLTESKASTDKRGWSFSKRSGRHRVLSNSVISELPSAGNKESLEASLPSAGNKESLEASNNDFHAQSNSTVPEKISIAQWADETPQFASAEGNSELSDSVTSLLVSGNDSGFDCNLQDSVAILIQAAIRGYLAQRALFKHKSAAKLQAAVRGHLVRRQAVGTLRCVQAIVKIQALVRGRRVRLSAEGSVIQEKLGDKLRTNNQRVNSLGKENLGAEANRTYSSSRKFLTNGFARQLLESTAKTERIHITCDPSKPDSTWKWLERWMSVSSLDVAQSSKPQVKLDCQDRGDANMAASLVGAEVLVEVIPESADLKPDIKEVEILLEGEDNLVANDADNFEFQSYKQTEALGKISSSPPAGGMEQPLGEISSSAMEGGMEQTLGKSSSSAMTDDMEKPQLVDAGLKQEISADTRKVLNEAPDSLSNQMTMQSDAISLTVHDSVSEKLEVDRENSEYTMERVASEQRETEGEKFEFGSRTSTNPAFAVQSKFEEMSSTATSGTHISSTYREVAEESKLDSHSPQMDSVTKNKDLSLTGDLVSHNPRLQIGGSECGTELSISSTLDSPDRSEVEAGGFLHETGTAYKGDSFSNGTADYISAEAKKPSSILEPQPTPSNPGFVTSAEVDEVNKNCSDSASDVDFNKVEQQHPAENIELPSENIVSDMNIDLVTDQAVESLSQEGTPRSHITAPESRGTPSSQVSLIMKGDKSDNSMRTQKRKFHSVGKRSPSQQNNDSAARSSMEHLPMDPKNDKRRNSLDHEPRVSNSNSLPSYMQATESARAKAHPNNSPKSSPDMQDKDIYIKKRHSLPVTNGKQDSPRMKRSMSHAQQSVKGNGTHSPQNATERRWQR